MKVMVGIIIGSRIAAGFALGLIPAVFWQPPIFRKVFDYERNLSFFRLLSLKAMDNGLNVVPV